MQQRFERADTITVFTEKMKIFRDLHDDVSSYIKSVDAYICGILKKTDRTSLSDAKTTTLNSQTQYVRWFIEHRSRIDDAMTALGQIIKKCQEEYLKRRRVVMLYPSRPTLDGVVIEQKLFPRYDSLNGVVIDKKIFTEEDAVQAMVNGTSMKTEKGYKAM